MSTQYPSAPPPNYNTAVNYGYPDNQGVPPPQSGDQAGYPAGYGYNAPPPAAPAGSGGYAYGAPQPAAQQPDVGFAYSTPDDDPSKLNNDSPFNDSSFSNKAIRRGFIRRVYLLLFAQLAVTFGITMVFTLVRDVQLFVWENPAVYYVSYATFLVTYIVLVCVPSVRRKHPGNLICLGVFTLAFSYMVGTISSFYDTRSVIICAGITTLVCLSISLFAIQTKIDFTMCSGLLFALVMVLILFGFSIMIVYFTIGSNRILDCVWGGLAALVFSLFLIYDTQMIVGGRKHELDPEEYVYGALQLYIDVVYLFIILLSCFGKSN